MVTLAQKLKARHQATFRTAEVQLDHELTITIREPTMPEVIEMATVKDGMKKAEMMVELLVDETRQPVAKTAAQKKAIIKYMSLGDFQAIDKVIGDKFSPKLEKP